jgi:competence protein ComEA
VRSWLGSVGVPFVVALAVVGLAGLIISNRPGPAPIEIRPLVSVPTPIPSIYVHVDGAVDAPGVYAFAAGARVFEAIDAAGGATEDAELGELNLAARVADGQKLVIPARRPPPSVDQTESIVVAVSAPPAAAPPSSASSPAKININSATQRILETLPGVGPVTAQRIIDYRTSNGPFTRVEQLRDTRLVNNSVFERIKALVSVD